MQDNPTTNFNIENNNDKACDKSKNEILSFIQTAIVFIFLWLVIRGSIIEAFKIPSGSMIPTLQIGDYLLVNKLSYGIRLPFVKDTIYEYSKPKRGDIVVFLPNGNKNSHYYLKRVIGLPGETVQIIGGYVYINGELLEEDESYDKIADPGIAENEIILGIDEYFVLGDNRNNSEDSRSGNIGIVDKDNITGKAWFHLGCEEENMGFIK